MRKNYVLKLGALALAVSLITTGMMGTTLARYVGEVKGTATATVAAWSFKVNGVDSSFTAIDLGSTDNRIAYKAEDIDAGVIAPGTSGSFKIELDGTGSGVGIDYTVKLEDKNDVLPNDLVFNVDGKKYTLGNDITGTINVGQSMIKELTVTWDWAFGENDTITTNDNASQGKKWSLDITATGKQVVPETTATPVP